MFLAVRPIIFAEAQLQYSCLLYTSRSAGQQAAILNKLVADWENGKFANTDKKLKELLGHTPMEVVAGAILGILIAIIRYA